MGALNADFVWPPGAFRFPLKWRLNRVLGLKRFQLHTSAFLGTNLTDKPITSGLPVTRESTTGWRQIHLLPPKQDDFYLTLTMTLPFARPFSRYASPTFA